ncbi:dipeptidylpeptidase [Coemansia sp. RSA 552]|nr:dipeptidylpeptidase [Coemansia sp. RSA 552]
MTIVRAPRSLPAKAFALGALARPFVPEDLVQTHRLGSVAVSPNGTHVAYIQTHYSIDTKLQATQLFVQQLGHQHPVRLTSHSADARPNPPSDAKGSADERSKDLKASQPVWLSDDALGFVATDPKTQQATLFVVRGGEGCWSKPHAILATPVPISDVHYSAASGTLAFTADVYGGVQSLEETAELDRRDQENRADTAQTYDELWVRHWDTFITPKLPQIHTLPLVVPGADEAFEAKGHARNIIKDTPGEGRLEVADSFTFSPDGRQVAFVAKKPGIDYAWRTTSYVYLADIDGSSATPINANGRGASASPVFNDDGSKIAYLQMDSATYEADRSRIKVYDIETQTTVDVASDWDRSPSQLLWANSGTLLVIYNDGGRNKLAKADIKWGIITPIVEERSVGTMHRLPGSDKLVVDYSGLDQPTDLFTVAISNGELARVSRLNPRFGEEIFLSPPEDVTFMGADRDPIHGYMLRPPNFDPQKKYPLAYVIHGGPQGSFLDSWSTRWNLNIFAAAGFVTVAMDPQGSTGYGQSFTDAIRNQWGGKPYESLMLSLEKLLSTHSYIDRDRLTALGASYGGYMVNWINGHTDVFKALVNHDGMFSTISTYYSTEELYFPETEFKGVPFDKKARSNYDQWSPERFVSNWRTPMLVVHSEKDYRLGVAEGLSTFTALRRQGVPARLLYFPDENHWVLKPANSLRWHQEVLGWISRWTAPEPSTGKPSRSGTD